MLQVGTLQFDLKEYKEIRSGIFNKNLDILRGTWFWQENDGSWVPYDHTTAESLEKAAQLYARFQLQITVTPPRIVVGLLGNFKQLRKTTNARPEGRAAQRGYDGKLM